MVINQAKAGVGLGTSGIGDNFARQRLQMAQKAGYVQSTPSPYSNPGTALNQYRSVAPLLNAVAQAQGQKGIPGLLRQGAQGRPPIVPQMNQQPVANYSSTLAQHAGKMPGLFMNQQPPHVEPGNIAANPGNGGSLEPGNGGYVPPIVGGAGGDEGGYPGGMPTGEHEDPFFGDVTIGRGGVQPYPPGTIANNTSLPHPTRPGDWPPGPVRLDPNMLNMLRAGLLTMRR